MLLGMEQTAMAQGPRGAAAQRGAGAQQGDEGSASDDENPCIDIDDHRFCWTIDPITGIQYPQVPDTSYIGMANRETMVGKSLGLVHTGNLYSPHLVTNIFDRKPEHDFIFVNAYSLFAHRPDDVLFYNTLLPYTTVAYSTSGTNRQSNDRLRINFAGNIDREIGLGTSLDYVYARGEYISQSTKPLNWTSYAYYNTDQYKAALTYNISKLANQENGGILDREVVLTPNKFDNSFTDPQTMEVALDNTWNDMDGWNLHFNHNYDLGFWEDYVDPADTANIAERFTSVASIFHSIDVEHFAHNFRMDSDADQTIAKNFFDYHYINKKLTQDSTAYFSFETYAGLRINEGFSKWSQFGLSAFVGYQHQSYQMKNDSINADYFPRTHISNNLFVGGQISRHQSSLLTFDATAKIGLSGDKKGDIDVNGQMQTVIPVKGDSITVQASGFYHDNNPRYMLRHFHSNHFRWSEDMDIAQKFNREHHLHLEGKFIYSLTGTQVKVGIEEIKNYHYFSAEDFLPHEHDKSIEVISAEISQNLHWKGIHWNNRLLLQTTGDKEASKVFPMPKLVWESDLSLRFVIAGALTTQLGITGYYFTKYYAPTYQPATQQFAVQDKIECGDYPLFNAYVNCNLKRIKFYVMYSGIGKQAFSNDAFIMPTYPLQSTRLEYGVVVDLQN